MSAIAIEASALTEAVLALFDEAYLEAPDPKGTWFTDNEPKNGFLGTIEAVGAERASRPLHELDPISLASHVGHIRFALNLANRALRGENPYAGAKWSRSWDLKTVDEAAWRALIAGLRTEYEAFRLALASGSGWKDAETLTGTLGVICHGAWHLGAIRQALGLVRSPTN